MLVMFPCMERQVIVVLKSTQSFDFKGNKYKSCFIGCYGQRAKHNCLIRIVLSFCMKVNIQSFYGLSSKTVHLVLLLNP